MHLEELLLLKYDSRIWTLCIKTETYFLDHRPYFLRLKLCFQLEMNIQNSPYAMATLRLWKTGEGDLQSKRRKLQTSWEEQNKLVEDFNCNHILIIVNFTLITWLSEAAMPLIPKKINKSQTLHSVAWSGNALLFLVQ